MSDEQLVFYDAESRISKEDFSFKEIVMRHLSKILQISSSEFREGYWQKKPLSIGEGVYLSEIYVEDKRLAYINAIDCLHDVLLPHFDKLMKEEALELEKALNKDFEENKDIMKPTEWNDKKLIHKRKLFQKLNLLLKRLGYLEQKDRKE